MSATVTIARLTLRRLARGNVLWASAAALALPALFATSTGAGSTGVVQFTVLLLAVLPALHLAPAVAEEVEDKTFTYLWSRPLPRWSVVTGKLLAVGPLLVVGMAAAVAVALATTGAAGEAIARAAGGVALGALGCGMVALGVGSLLPRFPLPVAIGYMVVIDLVVGRMPIEIHNASVTYHVSVIAGVAEGSVGWSVAGVAIIGLSWLAIGLVRATTVEYRTE